MSRPDQDTFRHQRGETRSSGEDRRQDAHGTDPKRPREATRDPRLIDPEKTPGSGMMPDDKGGAPSG